MQDKFGRMSETPGVDHGPATIFNKVTVRGIEKKQCQITVGDQLSFIGDEPRDLGGDGLGPNPFTLLLSALGLCTVATLRDAARVLELPLENVEVHLWYKSNLPPGSDPVAIARSRSLRMSKILRQVTLTGPLTEEQDRQLRQEAECCPVHNTLSRGLTVQDI